MGIRFRNNCGELLAKRLAAFVGHLQSAIDQD
jgi:hypothetical protein